MIEPIEWQTLAIVGTGVISILLFKWRMYSEINEKIGNLNTDINAVETELKNNRQIWEKHIDDNNIHCNKELLDEKFMGVYEKFDDIMDRIEKSDKKLEKLINKRNLRKK